MTMMTMMTMMQVCDHLHTCQIAAEHLAALPLAMWHSYLHFLDINDDDDDDDDGDDHGDDDDDYDDRDDGGVLIQTGFTGACR